MLDARAPIDSISVQAELLRASTKGRRLAIISCSSHSPFGARGLGVGMLYDARKYRLYLNLAHLGNGGIKVVGGPD